MKKISIVTLFVFILAACGQATLDTNSIQTAIAQTQLAQPAPTDTPAPTETQIPTSTPTLRPTNTPRPTNTRPPDQTATPETPAAPAGSLLKISKNYVDSQESGGVIVEIARIVVADKNAVNQDFDQAEMFQDKPVVAEFLFKIVNNTDKTISIYADQGTVAVGAEQVDLFDYSLIGARFGNDLGGDFLPGVIAIGGVWVGLKRTTVSEVTKITIKIDGPRDENFSSLGPDFLFNIEVADWGWEEIPDELK